VFKFTSGKQQEKDFRALSGSENHQACQTEGGLDRNIDVTKRKERTQAQVPSVIVGEPFREGRDGAEKGGQQGRGATMGTTGRRISGAAGEGERSTDRWGGSGGGEGGKHVVVPDYVRPAEKNENSRRRSISEARDL